MIDVDKYEGHYKASWANQYGDVVKLVYPNESSPSLDADQRLIIDAPLLLEEVKRLREKNEEFGYQLIEAIGLLKMSVRRTKDGRRQYAKRFERQTNAMLGREMIE